MTVDITQLLVDRLSRNHGPTPENWEARERPNYGVSASFDGAAIDLEFRFLAGSAYCCNGLGCHLYFPPGKTWTWFRRELAQRGIAADDRLEVRAVVVAEAGALFFDIRMPGPSRRGRGWGWHTLAPERETTRHEVVFVEGDEPDGETLVEMRRASKQQSRGGAGVRCDDGDDT